MSCFVCSQGRMPKFVLVTSIGTGDSQGAPPPQVYEALKPVLLEKVKAEEEAIALIARTCGAAPLEAR